jgi:hypothetical protein
MRSLAPIALFVYNRPEHTRMSIAALKTNFLAVESDLYIFSDAASNPSQRQAVDEVRSLIRDVDGFATVSVFERETNLGLAASITNGVDRLTADFGQVIVLEDDLVVSPDFLAFMNACLRRYENEERVMQISGYMYPGEFGTTRDTLFLPMISCWGWATWKRSWAQYDPDMSEYSRLKADPKLCSEFNLNGAYDYLDMLEKQRSGDIDSWGIRWHLSVFMMDGLVLYPAKSLVINAGIDGSGTHGRGTAALQLSVHDNEMSDGRIRFPVVVERNTDALRQVEEGLRAVRPGFVARMKSKVFR